jgi:hypothetical protein
MRFNKAFLGICVTVFSQWHGFKYHTTLCQLEGDTWAWSIGKDISHVPAASLGHYASLSFVVIGTSQNWGFRIEENIGHRAWGMEYKRKDAAKRRLEVGGRRTEESRQRAAGRYGDREKR